MTYYDVSMKISADMQVYKNKEEKKPVFRVASDFDTSVAHETEVTLNLHTGTHMDFPLHMIEDGQTSSELVLDRLIREVKVFDLTHLKNKITKDDLINLNINKDDFILFKTRNSYEDQFNFKFIYIDQGAALYLNQKQISGVGIDALGVERDQADHMTHKLLFEKDIYIIEGLRLKEVKQGSYFMYALPIKMDHSDALLLSVVLVA
ncbi:MAG: cyclase family protein [Acholeplasmataceae bacterium]|nr:cyclase family protein [Acholeplasmataceae bacterium]